MTLGHHACATGAPDDRAKALADHLNAACQCVTVDRAALDVGLAAASGDRDFHARHIAPRAHLFSQTAVFLARRDMAAMLDVAAAVEDVTARRDYREAALAHAPESARPFFGPRGAFMGYDFHIGADAPRLIEINTNAGGAFLAAHAAQALSACCDMSEGRAFGADPVAFSAAVIRQFKQEWQAQFGAAPLRRIAIVDDAPQTQHLYPEFLLAQRMMSAAGYETVIADASALRYADGELTAGGAPVDLVYNRLVDFALDEPRHAALRAAYLDGAVAVTPNPRAHALFADKRNLALLADAALLESWGVPHGHVQSLTRSLHAETLTGENAGRLWAARRDYVFKPAGGHGGKAVYRGDKITRGAWETVAREPYVAQAYAPPSRRVTMVDGAPTALKLDVRLYVHEGEVLMSAARLYQGQTTNFRTPGGGFAPVILV
jgi:hypothetical protein